MTPTHFAHMAAAFHTRPTPLATVWTEIEMINWRGKHGDVCVHTLLRPTAKAKENWQKKIVSYNGKRDTGWWKSLRMCGYDRRKKKLDLLGKLHLRGGLKWWEIRNSTEIYAQVHKFGDSFRSHTHTHTLPRCLVHVPLAADIIIRFANLHRAQWHTGNDTLLRPQTHTHSHTETGWRERKERRKVATMKIHGMCVAASFVGMRMLHCRKVLNEMIFILYTVYVK